LGNHVAAFLYTEERTVRTPFFEMTKSNVSAQSALSAATQLLQILILECNRLDIADDVRDPFVSKAEMKLDQVKFLSSKSQELMFGQLKQRVSDEAKSDIHQYAHSVRVQDVMTLLHLDEVTLPEKVGTPAVRKSLMNLVLQCT
jgi:hypothetical protein